MKQYIYDKTIADDSGITVTPEENIDILGFDVFHIKKVNNNIWIFTAEDRNELPRYIEETVYSLEFWRDCCYENCDIYEDYLAGGSVGCHCGIDCRKDW